MDKHLELIIKEIESLLERDRSINATEELYQIHKNNISKGKFSKILISAVKKKNRKKRKELNGYYSMGISKMRTYCIKQTLVH